MIIFEELESDHQQLFIDFYRKEGLNSSYLDEIKIYDIEEVNDFIKSDIARMFEDCDVEDFGWTEVGSGFFIKHK